MPYCPTCKKEYPLGTTICPECNVSLLENKGAELTPIFSLPNKEVADRFIESLNSQGIEATYEVSLRDDSCRIFVDKTKKTVAMKQFAAFQRMEKQDKSGAPAPAAPAKTVAPAPAAKPAASAAPAAPEEPAASDGETLFTPKNTAKSAVKAAVEKAAAVKVADAYEESTKDESPAYETAPVEPGKEAVTEVAAKVETAKTVVEEAPAAVEAAVEEVVEAAAPAVEEAVAPIAVTVETEVASAVEEVSSTVEEAVAAVEEPIAAAVEEVTETASAVEEVIEEAAPVVPEVAPVVEEVIEEAAPVVEEIVEEAAPAVKEVIEEVAPVVETVEEAVAPAVEMIAEVVPEVEEVSSPAAPEPVVEEPAPVVEPEPVAAVEEADDEEDDAGKESEEDSIPIEFTANAATRTKRPYYPKNESESPENDSEFESIFAAKKDNKKRTTLFAEMEKNEEAAAATTQEEGDSGFDFTPKRPLTAYQFEKKRQEDLVSYAMEHENEETATSSVINEDDGKVNISFSDYEQTYEVPSYEDADPTPVYSDPDKKIDWGAGADDTATDWQNQSSAGTEPIFVETERVNSDDIDDDKIIDENDIRSFNRAAAEAESEAYV